MSNLSYITHFKNKYPGAKVISSDSSLDVYKGDDHLVALRKNGAGQWMDVSEEVGASDKFCLAPIPKDSRVYKVVDGKVSMSEEAESRKSLKDQFLCDQGMKVLSCKELESKGWEFCSKQKVVKSPSK